MTRSTWRALLVCCAVALLGGIYAVGAAHQKAPVPEVACIAIGKEPYLAKLLIVGESWAAAEHLFPGLPSALSSKLGNGPVRVCSMAFNGETSGNIYGGLQAELARGTIGRLFDAQGPDSIIVLNGVNDEIRHVGASTYSRNTAKIVSLFPKLGVQVVTAPATHFRYQNVSVLLQVLVHVPQYVFDHGVRDPVAQYRAALEALHPEVKTIPFQEFLPTYDPTHYTPDGIHLTPAEFRRYGIFLAAHAVTPEEGVLQSRQHQQ